MNPAVRLLRRVLFLPVERAEHLDREASEASAHVQREALLLDSRAECLADANSRMMQKTADLRRMLDAVVERTRS